MRRRITRVARRDRIALSLAAVAAGAIAAFAVPTAAGQTGAASEPSAAPAPHVARVSVERPARRKVIKHRFRPWNQASPRQVREIIRTEARRSRISPDGLMRRIACESGFQWSAGNGPYRGLLQFHSSTFYRGMSTIRDRRVRLVRERTRTVRTTRVVRYSDGSVKRRRGRRVKQRVIHVYEGRIPRRPEITHTWAQVRIGAQAIRGRSAVSSSEWGCPA